MNNIPQWAGDYVGIPFDQGGRSKDIGLDCWGLVRVVYCERYGIELPSFEGVYYVEDEVDEEENRGRRDRLEKYVIAERRDMQRRGTFREVPLEEVREGDLLVIRTIGQPLHMGIVLSRGVMLNARRGVDVAIENYRSPAWASRVDAAYRHEKMEMEMEVQLQ